MSKAPSSIDPAKLLDAGKRCLATGRMAEAVQIARQLDARYPNNAAVVCFVGQIAKARGDVAAAEEMFSRAITLAPGKAAYYLHKADALCVLARQSEAEPLLDQALRLADKETYALQACGNLLVQLNHYEKALTAFTRALELLPDDAQLHLNIAAVHRFLGNLDEAANWADKAVGINPNTAQALFLRSDVRKATAQINNVADLRHHMAHSELSANTLFEAGFALSKEYEDMGQYDQAFDALQTANERRRKNFAYDVEVDIRRMDDIRAHYNSSFFERDIAGYQTDKTPVFILGMPRTGSTLLERFLEQHSCMTSAGERTEFSACLSELIKASNPDRAIDPQKLVEASVSVDFTKLGEAYIKRTSFYAGDTSHFIDKLPINFLYAGLIKTALPNAKIIHVRRDPMDTCYAIYKMLFDQTYPFAYDLEELASYYIAYDQLMTHWREILAEDLYELSYEDLVNDTEYTLKQALSFCELDWEDSCLDLAGNTKASTTASAAQARGEVYKSSLAKWKNFEAQLRPLQLRLQDAGLI